MEAVVAGEDAPQLALLDRERVRRLARRRRGRPGPSPLARRRRDSALPASSRALTSSLIRSPAIPAGKSSEAAGSRGSPGRRVGLDPALDLGDVEARARAAARSGAPPGCRGDPRGARPPPRGAPGRPRARPSAPRGRSRARRARGSARVAPARARPPAARAARGSRGTRRTPPRPRSCPRAPAAPAVLGQLGFGSGQLRLPVRRDRGACAASAASSSAARAAGLGTTAPRFWISTLMTGGRRPPRGCGAAGVRGGRLPRAGGDCAAARAPAGRPRRDRDVSHVRAACRTDDDRDRAPGGIPHFGHLVPDPTLQGCRERRARPTEE